MEATLEEVPTDPKTRRDGFIRTGHLYLEYVRDKMVDRVLYFWCTTEESQPQFLEDAAGFLHCAAEKRAVVRSLRKADMVRVLYVAAALGMSHTDLSTSLTYDQLSHRTTVLAHWLHGDE